MRKTAVISMGLLLALSWSSAPSWGGPTTRPTKAARPTEIIDQADCVSADCHVNVKQYRALHGPVNVNTCDACHALENAKTHTFQFAREKAALCTFCHEFDTGEMPVVHRPVITGECLGCHNPHGGETTSLTRESSTAALCGRCHESVALDKRFMHTPVGKGECDACHRPHASKYPKLLDAAGSDLCLSCHDEFRNRMAKVKFRHKAMEEGCGRCHDAHGSSCAMNVKEPAPDQCIGCHEGIKAEMAAPYKHKVVMKDRACLTCHTAHGSDLARLMSDVPATVCINCHDRPITAEGGRVIAAMTELNDTRLFKHGPIKEGQCSGCHTTHSGNRPGLLRANYETAFYQRFAPENYELCFTCHDVALVKEEQARGLTAFRNGDLNLHYTHANKGARGRSCHTCHQTHTAHNERNVRDSVPYGRWQLPIGFQKTPTGGTCVSGCHATHPYDREKPLARGTILPSERLAKKPPSDDRSMLVRWSGRDTVGRDVDIPVFGRPSVLLFLRAAQAGESGEVLRLVAAAVPDPQRARVVVIMSGKGSDKARPLAAPGADWPIIADVDYSLSARLGVSAWPATLVVQSGGLKVAHVAGAPQTLTVELEAFLDFATGQINRGGMNQRLAQRLIVADEPAKRAAQYLRVAETLLERGEPEPARLMLVDALKLQPGSAALQAAMIKALARVGRGKEAMELLKNLPEEFLPPWQENLLRGEVLMSQARWVEAKLVVVSALKAEPNSPDGQYLMGRLYERENQWQKAAEAYRLAEELRRKAGS